MIYDMLQCFTAGPMHGITVLKALLLSDSQSLTVLKVVKMLKSKE